MSLSVARFTLDDLRAVLRTDTGLDDADEVTPVNAGREFAELGYDSLAVLELVSQLRRHHGVHIPDEALSEIPTPLRVVDYVNRLFAERAAHTGDGEA